MGRSSTFEQKVNCHSPRQDIFLRGLAQAISNHNDSQKLKAVRTRTAILTLCGCGWVGPEVWLFGQHQEPAPSLTPIVPNPGPEMHNGMNFHSSARSSIHSGALHLVAVTHAAHEP